MDAKHTRKEDERNTLYSQIHLASHFKGLVHPKMKILSVFTHSHVVPNLYVFICSAEHKGRH